MNLIETHDLVKTYAHKNAVDHVNMHIPEGSIYGFVGENGSGKTTIMRLLTGLAEPTSGSFTLNGVSNTSSKIYEVRKQMSAIVEVASMVPSMTARDNLYYQSLYLGVKLTEEDINELLKKVHLDNVGNKKAKNFSLGMRQRLGIALALMNKPKLMLLDEPMNGLDPQGIADLRDLLIELNEKEGMTILISSHILSELEKIASHYGFISHGKLVEEITVEELQNKCRKSTTLKVDKIDGVEDVLKGLKLKDFKIYPNGDVQIFDDVDVSDLVVSFQKKKIKILSINSSDEGVEEYYLRLINSVQEDAGKEGK